MNDRCLPFASAFSPPREDGLFCRERPLERKNHIIAPSRYLMTKLGAQANTNMARWPRPPRKRPSPVSPSLWNRYHGPFEVTCSYGANKEWDLVSLYRKFVFTPTYGGSIRCSKQTFRPSCRTSPNAILLSNNGCHPTQYRQSTRSHC